MEKDTLRGILCVVGGLIMHLYLGCFYLWGNIQVYITSHLNKVDGPVSLEDTSIVFVLQTLSHAVFMPVAPFMLKYLPPWCLCLLGGIFSIGGVFISSFITSYHLFVIVYPITFGIGLGCAYLAPIVPGWEYFPNHRGLVSGMIVLGFGLGSFLFGFLSLAIANPDNEKADLEVPGGMIFDTDSSISDNAPRMIRINCAVWLVLLLIAMPMIRRKQTQSQSDAVLVENEYSEEKSEDANSNNLEIVEVKQTELTFKDALLNPTTLQIWTFMILSSCYPYYIASNFKSYEQKDVPDDQFITIVGSVASVFNGLSRSFWSFLQDIYGFKRVYSCLLITEMIIAFTIIPIHKVKALYLIWVCITFCCLGGHFSMFPTICARVYGPTTGGKIYSFLFTAFSCATITNWVLSKQSSNVIYILACLPILALISTYFFDDTPKTCKEQNEYVELSKNNSK